MMRILALIAALCCCAVQAQDSWRYPAPARVVAFGDVHGAYEPLLRTLRAAEVVDAEARWIGGTAHLVSVGDLLDRGPDSRKVLDLLMRLEGEAAAAGGRVHVLLGNHEVMNLGGELRDASAAEFAAFAQDEVAAERSGARDTWLARHAARGAPDALRAEFERRFPPGWFAHRRAFSRDGAYGRWLLARPAVVVVGDSAFAHGGFSPALAGYDLVRLNREFRAGLEAQLDAIETLERAGWIDFETPGETRAEVVAARLKAAGSATEPALAAAARAIAAFDVAPLYGVRGPVWYRGLALCRTATEQDVVAAMLAQFDVERLVVGHSTTPTLRPTSRFDGRVLLIDTGMLASVYGGRGHAVELVADAVRTIDEHGARGTPLADARSVGLATPGGSDAALARTLLAADIVARAPLEGERELLTLAHEGMRLQAWYYPDRKDGRRSRRELAAYRLDRLLDLGLVPVTVRREDDAARGAVQWRPDGLVGANDPITAPRWCDGNAELALLYAWDALILNEGRTETSVHWAEDGLLLAGDHRRAFGAGKGKPPYLADRTIAIGPELCRRLAALDAERLRTALDGAITGKEQDALLRRRDRLLGEARCARAAGTRTAR
ncbi:MAG TPA: metallophosphoesterase [Candidatus Saccharimonadia bacterium]|nr:metallophosphoesterase [Candidatus Saccharimonadia bacterium]